MKTTLAILLIILLGVGLGIGMANLRVGSAPWKPNFGDGKAKITPARPNGPTSKAVMKETSFDFGTLDMAGTGTHDFTIANAGAAPLELTSGPTSCRCTMTKLEHEKVPPGGSAKINLTWRPTNSPGPYQQTATILTNDPEQPRITLTISGKITVAVQFSPAELVFSRLSSSETAAAESHLLYYLEAPMKVLGHEWAEADTARFFEVALTPMSADEVKKVQPLARSGQQVSIRVKPGLPQGPIRQKLILKTDVPSTPTLTLPIQGTVGSEIVIVGPGWNADSGVVNLGEIKSSEGAQRRLLLVVRGPARRETSFTVAEVEPNVLKASLGRPSEINKGAVVQTPLLITVPPGSPAVDRIGVEPSRQGRIVLKTTHPQIHELQILVRFAVEN